MRQLLWLAAMGAFCAITPKAMAQEPPKPGPEFDHLKKMVGTWDATMQGGGKGVMTYKMDLGGLWLIGDFQGEFGGQKFSGRGADSFDANKKKYVGLWIDSMSTSPMVMEGTYDAAKKVLVMTGDGPGQDGKPAKFRTESSMKDNDTIEWKMSQVGPDGKEIPAFAISYKRKK